MSHHSGTVLCLAYVIGLLLAAILGVSPEFGLIWLGIAVGLGGSGVALGLVVPQFWRLGPKLRIWILAGLITALATVYLEMRIPQPSPNDISRLVIGVEKKESSQVVTVQGKVSSQPRLTRSQRVQFWFEATQVVSDRPERVTGKLYTTVPLLWGTGIYPGQRLAITGTVYQPKAAANPGAFDFKAYLARQGAFAGLAGKQISFEKNSQKPWWRLRQRIIQAQACLGSPGGPLLSSMVLGRRAVDLPSDIQDLFVKAGLAHVLAASGFHVSLLLGLVLTLTKRFSSRTQLTVGLGILFVYVGLTGIQPSVMRAALMGTAALIGLATERKVKQLETLLLTATLLLLFNPLWIFDLGFGLSFLATLGLIVTLPALKKRLDWLPPVIAAIIAIPVAASVWTLPLIVFVFNTVVTYSIPANIITAPLIGVISLGGMVSALAALIWLPAGSAIAFVFYYPIHLLIDIVKFLTALPGSSLAVGKMSLSMLLLIYGIICLVWLSRWWQRRWWLITLFAMALVIFPTWYRQLSLIQVTVLADRQEQVVVIQKRGKITLVSSGDANTVKYVISPFLDQQGINKIDCAVVLRPKPDRSNWSNTFASFPVENYLTIQQAFFIPSFYEAQLGRSNYELEVGKTRSDCSTAISLISVKPTLLQLKIEHQTWLFALERHLEKGRGFQLSTNIATQVFIWTGSRLEAQWLEVINPKVAIATTQTVEEETQRLLRQKQIELYWTGRDGAIVWTPQQGFQPSLAAGDRDAFLM